MPAAQSWPLASHFSAVLQNPPIAFRDRELKTVSIARDDRNQPRVWSGNFAAVYKGSYPNGRGSVAIRVFTSAATERRERYHAISEYLRNRRVEPLVDFSYADDGIRSGGDGKFYPLVTMDWVAGETLFKWVRRQCQARNRQALARSAELWIELVGQLYAAGIAHGDLQGGNVMVTDQGELKLVDYDCMCVPALVGRQNLEMGVDPYQHPERNHETRLSPELDNYSALFILAALKALAAAPDLWDTYVEKLQYDKLLFRHEDLDRPDCSPLIQALKRSPDAEVCRLCQRLAELTRGPIDAVPRLNEVLFSFGTVETLLARRDFDAAIELLTRNKKQPGDAPAPLQPRLREAQQRIKQRQELERAVAAGDELAMQRCYDPKLLDDYPQAQPVVAVARLAGQVLPVLKQLQAARQAKKWRELVQVWNRNRALLEGRKSAEPFAAEARLWSERNQACDVVLALVKQPDCDLAELSVGWTALERAGGHPEAEPLRRQILGLLERGRAWAEFRHVSGPAGETADAQLVKAWNEPLFAGWPTAERERPRVSEAQQRLRLVQQLRRQAQGSLSPAAEAALLEVAAALPPGYEYDLRSRIKLADKRIGALERLRQTLVEPVSDRAAAEAWEKLGQLEGQPLAAAAERARALLAMERAAALHILEQIPPNYTAHQAPQLDARLLATWNDSLLRGCRDAAPWQEPYDTALKRKTVLEQLKQAVAASDKTKIADLAVEPCLQHYPLPHDWVRVAKGAITEVKATRHLLSSLAHERPAQFRETFDARIVRHNTASFVPHKAKLCEWIVEEILPIEKLGLAPPLARKPLVREPASALAYRVCWQWPEPRFTEACLVAVCRDKPRAGEDPRKLPVLVRLPIERRSYEEGGGSRLIHVEPDWLGSYVAVWAVVDVGFQQFVSEPLILGRLEPPPTPAPRWKPGRIFGAGER